MRGLYIDELGSFQLKTAISSNVSRDFPREHVRPTRMLDAVSYAPECNLRPAIIKALVTVDPLYP